MPLAGILLTIINLFYGILYFNEFEYFEKMKSNNLEWPWKENSKFFKKHLVDLIFTYLLNNGVIFPLCFIIFFTLFPCRTDLESLPSFTEFWLTIIVSFCFEDFVFYWVHRFIHHPKLYWIHKKHHRFYNTISLACVYTHWIEYICGNIIPLLTGMMVF